MLNAKCALGVLLISICTANAMAQSSTEPPAFPVAPILFADEPFNGCEGISFNGEGRLFVTCNRAFWEIGTDGFLGDLVRSVCQSHASPPAAP